MLLKNTCCLNCNLRHELCHSTCDAFKQYKEELAKIKENRLQIKQQEALFMRRKTRGRK